MPSVCSAVSIITPQSVYLPPSYFHLHAFLLHSLGNFHNFSFENTFPLAETFSALRKNSTVQNSLVHVWTFFCFIFLILFPLIKFIYSLSTLSKFRPLWPTPSGKLINLKILCRRDAATAFFASIVRDFHEFLSRIMMKIIRNERMRENHRNMAQFQQQKQTKNIENKIHFFEG